MLGSLGQAMILVCTIAASALILPFFLLHGSHIYVTTLTMSSGGEDRFRWPRESYYEWFGQGAVVVGVLFIWSILALPIFGVMSLVLPMEYAALVWPAVMLLMAPISLCSVLTAPSKLLFLYPPLIGRLLQQTRGLMFVYFITTPLPMLAVVGLWMIVVQKNPLGIVMVCLILPPAIMLHARAWARLAWLALNHDRPPRKKKKKKRKTPKSEEPLEVDLDRVGEDGADYSVTAGVGPTGDRLTTMTEYYDQQHEYERELRERVGDPIPDPIAGAEVPTYRTALGEKVVSFVLEPESIGVCATYALVTAVAMILVYMMATMIG